MLSRWSKIAIRTENQNSTLRAGRMFEHMTTKYFAGEIITTTTIILSVAKNERVDSREIIRHYYLF